MANSNSKKKKVMIKIHTERVETPVDLFDEDLMDLVPEDLMGDLQAKPEVLDLFSEGTVGVSRGRMQIRYKESELTDMSGSKTEISFDLNSRGLVTLDRTGSVFTTLIFEEGRRHHCVYQTPIMPLDVCVHTMKISNKLPEGPLYIEYAVELRGARAEFCKMNIRVQEEKLPAAHL